MPGHPATGSRQATTQRLIGSALKGGGLVSLSEIDNWIEQRIEERLAGNTSLQNFHQKVPWLFRATELRAQAVALMPFTIMRGKEEVDSSDDYQNVVGFLPNPQRLFWLIEATLTLLGYEYIFREHNRIATTDLRHLHPYSVEPVLDEKQGLTGWTRRLDKRDVGLPLEDIVYFWRPDTFVEIGPPLASPGRAALNASGVLLNFDEFVEMYFGRGAVKATLLTVKGTPPEADRLRLKAWWAQFMSGLRNAFSAEVVSADNITPVVVGEGVAELDNEKLTNSKREDIATAIGVPHSLLFSNATNFATAKQDDIHFYSKTVGPEAEFIAEVLNEQVFGPAGYKLVFNPETVDAFQEDEVNRAHALEFMVAALGPENRGVALEILGFELPAEYEYQDFNAGGKMYAPPPPRMPGIGTLTSPNGPDAPNPTAGGQTGTAEAAPGATDRQQKALERRHFRAVMRKSPQKAATFEFKALDVGEQAELVKELSQERQAQEWQAEMRERFETATQKFNEAIQ